MKFKAFATIIALSLFLSSQALSQPNIILILTDDQRAGDWQFMPNLQEKIVAKGTTLRNFYAVTSLCCPSKSTILRGQFAHNTNVRTNSNGPLGGWQAFQPIEHSTIAVWLSNAGYATGLFGRYLNGFDAAPEGHVPPGWSKFFATYQGDFYYNYEVNEDGIKTFRGNAEADYQPTVVANAAATWIDNHLSANPGQPFFSYIVPIAPHALTNGDPPVYLSQHAGLFPAETVPRTQAFNEQDVSDKPSAIQALPSLTTQEEANLDTFHRARLRSLQSVDDMIADLIQVLYNRNQLQNTYIFLTSDNGFFLGEHRIPEQKNHAYEPAARVSAYVRGPGVKQNVILTELTGNVDLAPTFVDIANITQYPYTFDGRSLLKLIWGSMVNPFPRKAMLLENFRIVDPQYQGQNKLGAFVANSKKFIENYTGERELYDLVADPDEAQNLAPTTNTDAYAEYLSILRTCAGLTCKTLDQTPPP